MIASFEKVADLKRQPSRKKGDVEYCFSEKLAFFQNVAFLEKLMLSRSTCFEKVALL